MFLVDALQFGSDASKKALKWSKKIGVFTSQMRPKCLQCLSTGKEKYAKHVYIIISALKEPVLFMEAMAVT